jgi:hypothetical protein
VYRFMGDTYCIADTSEILEGNITHCLHAYEGKRPIVRKVCPIARNKESRPLPSTVITYHCLVSFRKICKMIL